MIPTRMNRLPRALAISLAAVAVAISAGACGTQRVHIPSADAHYTSDLTAAHLFNQRCGGCHTLSYAGTNGSGVNPRTYLNISGPNFNQRCERPAIRVLYAIENGGFSGAYMPQNVVVGQQARDVAMFVATFAGRQAPRESGVTPCIDLPVGTLPALGSAQESTALTVTTSTATVLAKAATSTSKKKHSGSTL